MLNSSSSNIRLPTQARLCITSSSSRLIHMLNSNSSSNSSTTTHMHNNRIITSLNPLLSQSRSCQMSQLCPMVITLPTRSSSLPRSPTFPPSSTSQPSPSVSSLTFQTVARSNSVSSQNTPCRLRAPSTCLLPSQPWEKRSRLLLFVSFSTPGVAEALISAKPSAPSSTLSRRRTQKETLSSSRTHRAAELTALPPMRWATVPSIRRSFFRILAAKIASSESLSRCSSSLNNQTTWTTA